MNPVRVNSPARTSNRLPSPEMPTYYAYLLECSDGSYYAGWTSDPARRLEEHRKGQGSRYTRSRRPLQLVYLASYATRSEAMRAERALKRLTHAQKRRLAEKQPLSP